MGCTTCGKKANSIPVNKIVSSKVVSTECEYTIEQVDIWLSKVRCVIDTGVYTQIPYITKKQLNIYLSTLLSAKNYADNLCYFHKELQEVESFITVLTASNLCNN